ncbi:hypothetical protein BV898_02244 [Hypsibius exemplaris]|uniref:Actin maturation protease n=1 Tax=Hypsibius exemplaris TaxID=2072580 RepID=A0A1W0X8N0_HYPEX|nr:hypothetical protein BV898_02244 [Hypsibius exemplaris]
MPPPPPRAPSLPPIIRRSLASLSSLGVVAARWSPEDDRRDILEKIHRIVKYVLPREQACGRLPEYIPADSVELESREIGRSTTATGEGGELAALEGCGAEQDDLKDRKWHAQIFMVHTAPCQQVGPSCGFAALTVVGQLFPPRNPTEASAHALTASSFESMLQWARMRNYTSVGEMFSTADLLATLVGHFDCTARLQLFTADGDAEEESAAVEAIREHVENGGLVVMPYDMGKNHEPALENGHSAHWCAIVGSVQLERQSPLDEVGMYVICRHGQSARHAVWNLRHLVRSNFGLREFGPKRLSTGISYVVKDHTDLKEIRGTAVFVDGTSNDTSVIWRRRCDLDQL